MQIVFWIYIKKIMLALKYTFFSSNHGKWKNAYSQDEAKYFDFLFRFLKCFKYYGGKIKECGHAYLSQISRVASIHYWSKFVKTKVSNAASAGNSRSKATYLTYSNSLSKHGFEQNSLQELFYLHELILSLSVLFPLIPSRSVLFRLWITQ